MRPHELVSARKALGLTQLALGAALEMPLKNCCKTIRRWESGRAPVPGPVSAAVKLMVMKPGRRRRYVADIVADRKIAEEGLR